MRTHLLLLFLLMPLPVALPVRAEEIPADEFPVPKVPVDGEVTLPAAPGWRASLVLDNGETGIWTVASFKVFPNLGCPEVVGLDDKGICHVLVSYSGRWTPMPCVFDGKWLGGLAHADIDPRIEGEETYTGSQRGNLYQVVAYTHGTLDSRLIAHFDGMEVHTIVAGDLDPSRPGGEILVFTRPAALFLVTPTAKDGRFEVEKLMDLPGRVRDAVVLPGVPGMAPEIATVSRTGKLELLRLGSHGPEWSLVHASAMGKGRIARQQSSPGAPDVLYSTEDDGRILRHERAANGAWLTEAIYAGPQGPRGIVSGQFHEDPAVEAIAIFGYSGRVELLSRQGDRWAAETLFRDRNKGHWLAAAELDGRNATREILVSGYGGRIVLLSRPPGFGLSDVAADG